MLAYYMIDRMAGLETPPLFVLTFEFPQIRIEVTTLQHTAFSFPDSYSLSLLCSYDYKVSYALF